MRPQFLIIGAPKCGTTWLAKRLHAHPEIAIPEDEVHFFSREWDRGWGWYEQQFAGLAGAVYGENSNSYLTEPGALERIRDAMPQVRLLAILRNPVDRAYSSYGMQVDRGRADERIDLYLDPDRSPRPHILANGLYADMLRPWYDAFPAERIHLALFDSIVADPGALYGGVLDFVGVDSGFRPANFLERENARKQSGVPGGIKRALWWIRPWFDRGPLRSLKDGAVVRLATRAMSRPKHYPKLTPALVARLADYYADDMRRLEAMSGLDLTPWRQANLRRAQTA